MVFLEFCLHLNVSFGFRMDDIDAPMVEAMHSEMALLMIHIEWIDS